jgi:hypothetical protein
MVQGLKNFMLCTHFKKNPLEGTIGWQPRLINRVPSLSNPYPDPSANGLPSSWPPSLA